MSEAEKPNVNAVGGTPAVGAGILAAPVSPLPPSPPSGPAMPTPAWLAAIVTLYLLLVLAAAGFLLVNSWPEGSSAAKPARFADGAHEEETRPGDATNAARPAQTVDGEAKATIAKPSPTVSAWWNRLPAGPWTPWNPEQRFFVVMAAAGVLGSVVHAFRSLFWYIGNRHLVRSWLLMYVLLPVIGAVLAIIFLLVLKGGLFSGTAKMDATNPYGFAALGALAGMFSQPAVIKLKAVFEILLTQPKAGKDSIPQETAQATIPKTP